MKRLNIRTILFLSSLFLILTWMSAGCKKDSEEAEPTASDVATCEGCHTNYAHLQKVYSPDTAAPPGGCGGSAPQYEPYDRVYMGGDGYKAYKKSSHNKVGCVGCHNGVGNTSDKQQAHSGDFISHPSMFAADKCAKCHRTIVEKYATSIHNGTGQKRKVTMRSGLQGPQDFDKLPAHQIEGYNKNCATCHATCGNCHIVRPPIGGGGLSNGHAFTKTPDMVTVCVTCHVSRGGHAYMGVASGTQPDVHLTKMNFSCVNCHSGEELHGDGNKVEQRYAYKELPTCVECHSGLEHKNVYHSQHYTEFNCQVCHSQDYNNCGSCHIHGAGARVPSYQGFKIARNPIPYIKTGFKFTLVRRTLAAPDNWKEYGVPNYGSFNVLPTYNYTSPHNILRWTSRTKQSAGQSCYSNCHIRNENGELKNTGLYLFQADLLPWEFTATMPISVDKQLPESWFNE
jgi:thiosulfate/3-mercaptopyruvate sulfurtransferase